MITIEATSPFLPRKLGIDQEYMSFLIEDAVLKTEFPSSTK